MIDTMIGAIMIVGAIIAYFVAGLPLTESILGGEIAENLRYMAGNAFWIIPAGTVLAARLWMLPHVAAAVFIGGTVVLFILINWSVIFP